MATEPDPYRTLGLTPDASPAQVKAAYRRLAKAFHPDAAGEAAMPRFIAIHAAYEAIIGHSLRRPGEAGFRAERKREPWRADPDRTNATRDAWRSGGGRARPTGTSGSPGASAGPAGGATRSGGPARPDGPASTGGQRSGTGDARSSGGAAGRRRADGSTGRKRPEGGRSRSSGPRSRGTNRATPGSTSYDHADQEGFNPEWSGASWYGTTSGTYWTINPKEYADPRKHGPEYQARARRGGQGPSNGAAEAAGGWEPDAEAGTRADGPEAAPAAETDAGATAGRGPRASARFRPAQGPPPSSRAGEAASAHPFDPLAVLRLPGGLRARVALALLGWPPLGYAFASFIGEASGCSRFEAGCVEPYAFGTWLGQLAVIALLLAIPRLASIAAIGTLAMLTASIPGAIVLSVSGGAQERDAAVSALTGILLISYVAGVVFATLRSTRTIPP